jgi:Flp pilus assembly protein TadG
MMGIGIAKSLAALGRDRRGNVLPIFAASLIPLLAIVGGGVDASRGYLTKTQLQNACDAGALAGRRAMAKTGEYTDDEEAKATSMFDANFEGTIVDAEKVTFETRAGDEGEVFGTATATIPTVLMQLFGTHELSFSVGCMAELQITNTDVMFVLDTTGSMGGSRIKGLRDAVRDFHETIASAVTDDDVRVRYGFVPYSTTVNASELLKDPDDLLPAGDLSDDEFRDTTPYQTRVAVFDDYDYVVRKKSKEEDGTQYTNYSEWDCRGSGVIPESGTKPQDVTVIHYEMDYNNYRNRCEIDWQRYRYKYEDWKAYHFSGWIYRQADLNTSDFKVFDAVPVATGFDPELSYVETEGEYTVEELATFPIREMRTESSTWNGCLQERDTVETNDFDPVPDDAFDLDIDLIPNSEATRWSPIWPAVSYRRDRGTVSDDDGTKTSSAPCPAPMLPFQNIDLSGASTDVPDWLDDYLEDLNATGNTYHDIGMIWGARLASTDGVLAGNVTAGNLDNVSRHLIFMTDGAMEPHTQLFTAYGVEWNDNRIAPAWASTSTVASRHTQRFLVACTAAKAEGYTVWVIGFGSTLTNEMKACATGHRAYYSDDSDELRATFRYIASQVADLRLGQ